MAIGRRGLLVGSTALGLGAAAVIVGYRVMREPSEAIADEPGLIGLWRFNETEGDRVRDASGFRNDGVIIGPNANAAHGIGDFVGSVSVGGADANFVRIPATESLNSGTNALTVTVRAYPRTLWAPTATYDGHLVLVQRQWRTAIHPDLFYLGYGPSAEGPTYKWHIGLAEGEPSIYAHDPAAPPTVGRWVHLAGVFDGATGEMSLYADGKLITSRIEKGHLRLDTETLERPVIIGAELNGASIDEVSGPFDGHVDEVRIYERALTGPEIATLALARSNRG